MTDFFTNPDKINVLRKILIVAFVILLLDKVYQIVTGASDDYYGLALPVVFILLMVVKIRKTNKDAAHNSDVKS